MTICFGVGVRARCHLQAPLSPAGVQTIPPMAGAASPAAPSSKAPPLPCVPHGARWARLALGKLEDLALGNL